MITEPRVRKYLLVEVRVQLRIPAHKCVSQNCSCPIVEPTQDTCEGWGRYKGVSKQLHHLHAQRHHLDIAFTNKFNYDGPSSPTMHHSKPVKLLRQMRGSLLQTHLAALVELLSTPPCLVRPFTLASRGCSATSGNTTSSRPSSSCLLILPAQKEPREEERSGQKRLQFHLQ